ncbi:MAG: transcription termination/antitermination NusG family protein [Candidatus Sulfobium sp.]|jgi:transcriptional antiterminator RfaH
MVNWYAIYTKPGAEDSATRLLTNAGIETFNPKIRIRKYVRKKFTEVIEQLFPSYIFASFDPGTHGHMIKYTRGVRYVVGKEYPLVVPPEMIEAIRERMEDGVVKPEREKFETGDRVLIKEGPFKDFYGIFERNLSGRERVVILLEALFCRVEIERFSIKKD